jgi:glycine oxidase
LPDVVVVGGGVIGSAIAYELQRSGASVTLLERSGIAAEASGAAAGIMAPRVHATDPAVAAFALHSMERFPSLAARLREETGQDVELVRSGVLDLAHDEGVAGELQERIRRQQALGYAVSWLDSTDALELEPGVNPQILGAYYDPDAYHVHPARLTAALAAGAQAHGAEIRVGVEVLGVEQADGRVSALQTSVGSMDVPQLVICTGSWASTWGGWLGAALPVFPVKGQILSVMPAAPVLRTVVWDPDAYLLPRVDGSVVVGATLERAEFDKQVTARGLGWLLNSIPGLCPGLSDARFERAWAGLRPGTPDDQPIVGRLPGWDNVFVATGHYRNGITLAPATGSAVARLVTKGELDPLLAPFDPARFGA